MWVAPPLQVVRPEVRVNYARGTKTVGAVSLPTQLWCSKKVAPATRVSTNLCVCVCVRVCVMKYVFVIPGTCRSPNAPGRGHSPGWAAPCDDGVEEDASLNVKAQVSLHSGYIPLHEISIHQVLALAEVVMAKETGNLNKDTCFTDIIIFRNMCLLMLYLPSSYSRRRARMTGGRSGGGGGGGEGEGARLYIQQRDVCYLLLDVCE